MRQHAELRSPNTSHRKTYESASTPPVTRSACGSGDDRRGDEFLSEAGSIPDEVRRKERKMSGVRVLVGTRKGAFTLTSDGTRKKWTVNGPHFGGWEIYHVHGSPADPNRLYASQSSGWFG